MPAFDLAQETRTYRDLPGHSTTEGKWFLIPKHGIGELHWSCIPGGCSFGIGPNIGKHHNIPEGQPRNLIKSTNSNANHTVLRGSHSAVYIYSPPITLDNPQLETIQSNTTLDTCTSHRAFYTSTLHNLHCTRRILHFKIPHPA